MSQKLSGRCLCGAVQFETSASAMMAGHCQCVDCRKSSGSGHCTHVAVPEDGLQVSGPVTFYVSAADSGNEIRRGFCGVCGCPIMSTNAGMPGMAFLRASALDDPDLISPSMVVYASRAPAWDHMDPALPAFDTMPPDGPPV